MTVGDPLSPLVQKIAELERRLGAVERPNALATSGISSQVQWVKDNKTAIVWSKDEPSVMETPGQTDGDAWYRTNTAEQIIGVWQWDGATWVSLTDKATSDAAQAAHDASVAAAVAESVANTAQTAATQAVAEAATAKDVADAAALAVVDAQTAADQAGLAADAANTAALNASNAAAAAAGVADGKGKVLIQSATPAAADRLPQNLWIDTTGGANTPKKWDGSAWAAVSDKAATDAAADAAIAYEAATQAAIAASVSKIAADNAQGTASTALTTANGKNKSVFSTSPASGAGYTVGDIWFQTSGGSIVGQWEFTSFGWVSRNIDNAVIANLDAGKITAGILDAARIAARSITSEKIAVNSITANELAANSITAAKIAAGAVTAGKIAAGTVTATELAADSVVANSIAANSVTTDKIAANSVTANELAANAVTADKIYAGSITAVKIAADAIDATKLSANAITAKHTITGALVRTAASGSRTEMTNQGIRQLDSTGKELVKIGYGIPTGMSLNSPITNIMTPLSSLVFGAQVFTAGPTASTNPGGPGVFGNWARSVFPTPVRAVSGRLLVIASAYLQIGPGDFAELVCELNRTPGAGSATLVQKQVFYAQSGDGEQFLTFIGLVTADPSFDYYAYIALRARGPASHNISIRSETYVVMPV